MPMLNFGGKKMLIFPAQSHAYHFHRYEFNVIY
jgi:hypothetical protein